MSKPRRWFQIHLSTAIVLMLVAGLLLHLNFTPRHSTSPGYDAFDNLPGLIVVMRGWPAARPSKFIYTGSDPNVKLGDEGHDLTITLPPNGFKGWRIPEFDRSGYHPVNAVAG